MNVTRTRMLTLLAAAGAATGAAQAGVTCTTGSLPAPAPSVIHISGATLQESFLRAPAATNDYIDVDGDGNARAYPGAGGTVDQLAPYIFPPAGMGGSAVWSASVHWGLTYSANGSGTGLQELVDFGRSWVTTTGSTVGADLPVNRRTTAYFNSHVFISNGVLVPGDIGNPNNPGGNPIRAVASTSPVGDFYTALYTTTSVASTGGGQGLCSELIGAMSVDIAPMDVPTSYFAIVPGGAAVFNNLPLTPGYGDNAFTNPDKDGTFVVSGSRTNKLITLGGGANLLGQLGAATIHGCAVDPIQRPIADSNTIFDTPTAHAPVAAMVNFGVGKQQIDMSDLRYLTVAGRMSTGENLNFVARQSGSGTRAAWATSLGIDPSFAKGDGVGINNNGQASGGVSGEYDRPGLKWLPANKNGSGNVDTTVINCRTCVGHNGAERGVANGWLTNGSAEVLAVRNNVAPYNGSEYSRPSIGELLHNDANGYVIAGPASFATFGDPRSASEAKGGYGWMEPFDDTLVTNGVYDLGEPFNDVNGNGVRDAVEPRTTCERPTLYPAMRNEEAAAYINNIMRSVDAFVALPGSDETVFTPGELLAKKFVLLSATDYVKQSSPVNPTVLVSNPAFNGALQTFTSSNSEYADFAYQAFGNATRVPTAGAPGATAGKVPSRIIAGGVYSDQALVPSGDKYAIQDASMTAFGQAAPGFLAYGTNLGLRNLVAGDFNADGLRNINDAADMIAAWRQRTGGPAWVSPAASGSLASLASTLAAQGTFFNADVRPGVACIEILGDYNNDGSFDAYDLRFWADGFAIAATGPHAGKLDRKAGFIVLDNALNAATAGADHNVFNTVLKTGKPYAAGDARGDVANVQGLETVGFQPIGADGYLGTLLSPAEKNIVDAYDIDYVYAQFKTNHNPAITDGEADWSVLSEAVTFDLSADMTGDLVVNQDDVVELVTVILGTSMGDVNLDGVVNSADQAIVNASIATPPASPSWANGDLNGDGVVNAADLALVVPGCAADFNGVNGVTVQDIFDFLTAWLAGNSSADFNHVNGVTVQDIFDFLTAWLAGC